MATKKKLGEKGGGGASRCPPSKRDDLGKDTAGKDGVTVATQIGWTTMQATKTKLTREERTGKHNERLDCYYRMIERE